MTYLFLGEDTPAKDAKIAELKKKTLSHPQSFQFDFEICHAAKLDPSTLKKALMNLPAMAPKRLIILRDCHRLTPRHQDIIVEFLEKSYKHAVLILDSNEWEQKSPFVKKIRRMVEIVEFSAAPKPGVFDLARAVESKKETEALKVLDQLLGQGIHPLQILGRLVWSWGKSRRHYSKGEFEKGLLALQEADVNIKRSRLKPEYAMEVLVVKLCLT